MRLICLASASRSPCSKTIKFFGTAGATGAGGARLAVALTTTTGLADFLAVAGFVEGGFAVTVWVNGLVTIFRAVGLLATTGLAGAAFTVFFGALLSI